MKAFFKGSKKQKRNLSCHHLKINRQNVFQTKEDKGVYLDRLTQYKK